MIRLVIIILFLIMLWLLIASGFERRRKIVFGILLIGFAIGAFLFEGYDKRELKNLVEESQVQSCGISAQYTYRSNYDLKICVQNLATNGTISRLKMAITASKCPPTKNEPCMQLNRVIRDIPVKIVPESQLQILQNLSFDQVDPNDAQVRWSVEILDTKATRG